MNKKSQRYKSLFSDTTAFLISNFASKILVFLMVPLYTSVLTTTEYGIADFITNTINLLYPILTLSIMEATLRFAFDKDISVQEVLANSLIVIVLSEIIVIAFMPAMGMLSQSFDLLEPLKSYCIWFAVIYFGFNLQQVMSQYIKGIGNTRVFAFSGILQTVVVVLTNVIGLLYLKWGLTAYLLSIALGYYLSALYIILFGKISFRRARINIKLLKDMLLFSIPMIPTLVSWWISTSADKYILIAYRGLAESGVYSVAYKIPSVLTLFSNIFTSAWTISVIKSVSDEDKSSYQSVVYKFYNSFNVLVCTIFISFSKILGKMLFSQEFFEAWHCVPMLLVAYLFACLSGFLASSFRAEKDTKGLFITSLVGSITNILLNFIFIMHWGMMGAAFTTILGFGITFFLREKELRNKIGLFVEKKNYFVYVLLFLQAYVMGNEYNYYYYISIIFSVLIIVLYIKDYMDVIVKFGRILCDRIKRH
ncbi:lipopolysaccharide biosynthesis protein [Butyrivibrio sp. WCD3002]|uniref:lipopolysaccharide biosynthesis protein n=1 Tax=Butyrivibrio sp. WCD3002 TaxID=1280676 RepID=UPI00040454B8|nr:oligosaccharide flippase family protein [Butyrivibrio sp. WCD3002]